MATSNKKSKAKKNTLTDLRSQLKQLVNKANRRAKALKSRKIESRALLEAQRTYKRRDKSGELFKSELRTREQILNEFARVNQFLNDYTSTVKGARRAEKHILENLKGAFGSEWNAIYGVNYDKSRINDESAKEAFRLYRLLQEEFTWTRIAGVFKGKEGLVGYGSEVLINYLYDMVVSNSRTATIMEKARQMIEDAEKRLDLMARRQVLDEEYGIVIQDPMNENRKKYIRRRSRG